MTPFETFQQHYSLPATINGSPLVVHPLQIEAINTLAPLANSGCFLDTGTGKTLVETVVALYRKATLHLDTVVIIMPPLLLKQWGVWLRKITPALSITEYRGTPREREAMSLNVDVVLVGIQIFKKEHDRFVRDLGSKRYMVAVDEANMLSNINSDNHQKVMDFAIGQPQDLLTGTPATNPMDAYGILKFTAPGTYRSQRHFINTHVEEVDFYDKPTKFQNLDLLRENLKINSHRILFEDMYPDAATPLFVPVEYDLEPAHARLYRKLAEEELLALPDGGKIDATVANNLIHALGQIVVNWGHFTGNPKDISNAIHMIQGRLDELGDGKLVVFGQYRMSIALITDYFKGVKARAINGDVTPKAKERAVTDFVNDPACRLLVVHPKSGGVGLDGLQHVCHHMMFIEPVRSHRDFHQAVARLKRTGQKKKVVVSLPTATGTTQVQAFRALLKNDETVGSIIRNARDLRSAIFGDDVPAGK